MISADNDCKQIRMDHLSRPSQLSHLFGRSVVDYTTGHWSARYKKDQQSSQISQMSQALKTMLEESTAIKFVVVKDIYT